MRDPAFVSIHASSREDATPDTPFFLMLSMFQSTRPRGRTRHFTLIQLQGVSGFNPRVLAGGRDFFPAHIARVTKFQSTRPRGRTRPITLESLPAEKVSIHASSREDATLTAGTPHIFSLFQSTRPRGRTRHTPDKQFAGVFVSIHASSREDATIHQYSSHTFKGFNPRVLAGGRD